MDAQLQEDRQVPVVSQLVALSRMQLAASRQSCVVAPAATRRAA